MNMQVFDGKMEGMKSLNRSSDALLTYSEETGSPVFSIATSLMLSNITVKSGAKGEVSFSKYQVQLKVLRTLGKSACKNFLLSF